MVGCCACASPSSMIPSLDASGKNQASKTKISPAERIASHASQRHLEDLSCCAILESSNVEKVFKGRQS